MNFELVPVYPEIDIIGFHSVYYFEFDKNFYHLPEKHDFWEMVYVDDGCINAIVDGIGCSLHKGQAIFHQPMEVHSHIANKQDASNIVVISFSCPSPLMSYFNKKVFTLEKNSVNILSMFLLEARNALGQLPGEYENKSPLDFSGAEQGSVQLMQCYLVEFLFSVIRSNQDSVLAVQSNPDSRRLAESSLADSLVNYIQQHLQDPPSLEQLCAYFAVSRTGLCRIFNEATGNTPVNYWIVLKVREAKKLIREGNLSMTQIAEKLGYASIHHFSRMFKRFTGMSPSAYQQSVML